jgi:DNA-binding HxlR family transcriptional regulator
VARKYRKTRSDIVSVVCDYWTLHILSEIMTGNDSFNDIVGNLPIARNILSNRLSDLLRLEIICRSKSERDGRCIQYSLGRRSDSIMPLIASLWNWSEWDGAKRSIEDAIDR